MPNCLLFDPWTMKTLSDLASVAETEIENYLGGYNLCDAPDIKTKRQFNTVKNYLSALKPSIKPCGTPDDEEEWHVNTPLVLPCESEK